MLKVSSINFNEPHFCIKWLELAKNNMKANREFGIFQRPLLLLDIGDPLRLMSMAMYIQCQKAQYLLYHGADLVNPEKRILDQWISTYI